MSNSQSSLVENSFNYWKKFQRGISALSEISDDDITIGSTPKRIVARNDKTTLYHYEPRVNRSSETPLLIVYGQIGRYTMIDLQPDRSVVRNLLDEGIDVYLIDWGSPNRSDRWIQFDDYIEDYLASYVDIICEESKKPNISLLGICEGGVFSACYSALHPERVRNLSLAVTPIDFHADKKKYVEGQGYLNRWVRNLSARALNNLIDSYGHMPGDVIGMLFQEMTPVKTLTKYNWDLADNISGNHEQVLNFLRMEKWLSDRPHHPGEAAKTWLVDLYKNNQLVKKKFRLDGHLVDLGALDMPILNIFSSFDHIIPPSTSKALSLFVGTKDYSELELSVGHIGTFVSKKANLLLSETLSEWLIKR